MATLGAKGLTSLITMWKSMNVGAKIMLISVRFVVDRERQACMS